jgi:hypothetical protein
MSKFDFEVSLTNDFTLVVRPVDTVQLDPYRQEFTFPHEVFDEFMREISEDDLLGDVIDVLVRTASRLDEFRNEIYGEDEM